MSERFEVYESYGAKAALLQQFSAARASQSPETCPGHDKDPSSSAAAETAFEDICSSALPISLDELRCRYFSAVHTPALSDSKLSTASSACMITRGSFVSQIVSHKL